MFTDIDTDGKISINDMTITQAETILIALVRVVEQLPQDEQTQFSRLLIDIDKLTQKQ